jgi:hypothetical protein
VRRDHGAGGGSQDRLTEGKEPLGRFRREERPPVAVLGGPAAMVHRDEVDRIPLAQQVGSVTRNPPGGTILSQPPTSERQGQDNLGPQRFWVRQTLYRRMKTGFPHRPLACSTNRG